MTDQPRKRFLPGEVDPETVKRVLGADIRPLGGIDPEVIRQIAGSNIRPLGGIDFSAFQINLPASVVEGWRSTLEDANTRLVREVSGSMAEVIAGASVSRIPDWADLRPVVDSFGSRITEQLQPYIADFSRLQSDVQRWIQPAALAAATDFSARMKGTGERFRKYQRALREQGWWMPPSIGIRTFWEIGQLADEGRKRRLSQRMVEIGTSPAARRMVNGWMDIPVFRNRRRFILDGLQDIHARRWRVAVPTLLPMIEGITVEVFEPGSKSGPRAVLARAPIVSVLTADALVETVGILFQDTDFATTPPASRVLNRHMVLHGRSTGYGRGENAVKVLFALDQLASTVRHAKKP